MLKNDKCVICGKESNRKSCSPICRGLLMALRKAPKTSNYSYLADIRYFLSKYSPEEAYKKFNYCKNFKAFFSNTLVLDIVPYPEYKLVLNRIENMEIDLSVMKKLIVPNTIERWKFLGFSVESSKIIAESFSTSKNGFKARDKNNYSKKYEDWKTISITKRKEVGFTGDKCSFSKKYWLKKGLTEEESNRIVKELNTRDINYFINKYGEDRGLEKYYRMCEKRAFSSSRDGFISNHGENKYNELNKKKKIDINFFINKYGIETGKILYEQHLKKRLSKSLKSKPARILERILVKNFLDVKDEIFLDRFLVDFKINNVVIEENGDWWHMNPLIYSSDDYNKVIHKKAEEVWKYDSERRLFLNSIGCSVITVWEMSILKRLLYVENGLKEIIPKIHNDNKILNFDFNLDINKNLIIKEII